MNFTTNAQLRSQTTYIVKLCPLTNWQSIGLLQLHSADDSVPSVVKQLRDMAVEKTCNANK